MRSTGGSTAHPVPGSGAASVDLLGASPTVPAHRRQEHGAQQSCPARHGAGGTNPARAQPQGAGHGHSCAWHWAAGCKVGLKPCRWIWDRRERCFPLSKYCSCFTRALQLCSPQGWLDTLAPLWIPRSPGVEHYHPDTGLAPESSALSA